MDIQIASILPNLFLEDIRENSSATYLSQIGIVMIKSLLPSKADKGNRIDYERFIHELKLWKYYSYGDDPVLLNPIDNRSKIDRDLYFAAEDPSIIFRIITLIIANEDFESLEDEVVKNILFFNGNLDVLFEHILISKMLHMLIKKEEDIISKSKEYIISLSQLDFLKKYESYYKLPLDEYPGNYTVNFERKRILLLNALNEDSVSSYKNLRDLRKVINGETGSSLVGRAISASSKDLENREQINKFYKNMFDYILRLRKGRVDPDKLIIEDYILPDIFSYKENQTFFHSLLRESKVIKKEVSNNVLTSTIQTKTGMYTFKRDLN